MKPFHLESSMKTMGGVFYPTGYMILMYPSEQAARDACRLLGDNDLEEDEVVHITPEDFLEILGAAGDDEILPSAGSEGDTVRRFAELSGEGHHALMIHAPHAAESDRVMEVLKDSGITYGQKYRHFVIEDLVG